jgi:hypothetical protein
MSAGRRSGQTQLGLHRPRSARAHPHNDSSGAGRRVWAAADAVRTIRVCSHHQTLKRSSECKHASNGVEAGMQELVTYIAIASPGEKACQVGLQRPICATSSVYLSSPR